LAVSVADLWETSLKVSLQKLSPIAGSAEAAGEDPSFVNRDKLWNDVEKPWQQHVAGEEPLILRVAPLFGPERVVPLITLLRRAADHSLTRQHPQLLRGGWPTRLAIRAQYRFDRWRDVLDNRGTWRTGG